MSPTSSLDLVQFLMVKVYSRRLLLHTPLYKQPSDSASSLPVSVSDSRAPEGNLDANVVMILAVLLCALIVALGLNSIVRCALRCANRMALEPESSSVAARLALVGAKRKALKALPTLVYSAGMRISGTGSECTICLSDLAPGEQIRVLPKCNHGFHVRCIDRWLMARPSCPTCRQCLVSAGQNVSGCSVASSSGPVQSTIMPLEPEGLITNYR